MDKEILRNQLFAKYFEEKEGLLLRDLVDKLSFIPALWKELHILCQKNIELFNSFSNLQKIKMIEHNLKKYLILKLEIYEYVIIDVENMKNTNEEEFVSQFDEEFFVRNFNEIMDDDIQFSDLYLLEKFNNVEELVNFYNVNQDILSLSSKLYYKFKIEKAWSYLYIDFVNANIQLVFQTADQFLYETLFFNFDLTPYGLQDAKSRIGVEKMKEIFEKVKDIIIPKEIINSDLYEQYILKCNSEENEKIIKLRDFSKINLTI